ncbi:hypothetical protein J0X14_14375 [Muricauda sp. CAU 1633]|uniref:hypothetical protein n=1 Tax=Allomuricauda sp. CAU 1633 TaxID=2816036 RepID=UPI001A8D58B4|nr:hypothetical protein [Muricauda sp. CAU 1633]MBO0323491.1 hypothetical protein [Muricauda sp. CAU 1633]
MLSNKDKKKVVDDLVEFRALNDELSKMIMDQKTENKKEKEKVKKILKDNPDLLLFLGI